MNQSKFKQFQFVFLFLIFNYCYSQSNFEKILKGGEIIVNGLSILKTPKTNTYSANNNILENLCVKNKLHDKITFSLVGKDEKDNEIKKELIIPQGGKECTFNLVKGIWTYEIILSNKEIYKKGEYKLEESIVITVE